VRAEADHFSMLPLWYDLSNEFMEDPFGGTTEDLEAAIQMTREKRMKLATPWRTKGAKRLFVNS